MDARGYKDTSPTPNGDENLRGNMKYFAAWGDTSPTPQRGRKLLFHRDNFPRLPDTSPTPNGTKTPRLYHTFQTQSTHPLPFTGGERSQS